MKWLSDRGWLLALCSIGAFGVLSSAQAAEASRPKPPDNFCVNEKCAPERVPSSRAFKFNPGHYMTLDGIKHSPEIQAERFRQIDAIANEPTIKGVALWIYWADVEKTPGDYSAGYALIDAYLKKLSSVNKRLMLSVIVRHFGGYDPNNLGMFFPQYIIQDSKYGTSKMRNGITTRSWQAPTMDRLIALSRALGKRYDSNRHFEMYQIDETSVAVPLGEQGYTIDAYSVQLKRFISAARSDWPHTMLRVQTNYFGSDKQMLDLIQYCATYSVAVGGPDVIPNQTIQANSIYNGDRGGGKDLRGKLPFIAEIQSPSLGGHEGTFTPREIYEHALREVQPQYFVWLRNTYAGGPEQKWNTGILPFIRSVKGVVKSDCPTLIAGRCTS
jgi:hypothetical protein